MGVSSKVIFVHFTHISTPSTLTNAYDSAHQSCSLSSSFHVLLMRLLNVVRNSGVLSGWARVPLKPRRCNSRASAQSLTSLSAPAYDRFSLTNLFMRSAHSC